MRHQGHPHGHAVIEDGDQARSEGYHADLNGRRIDGNLQKSRNGNPRPIATRRYRQFQPKTDRQQYQGPDNESVAGKGNRRKKEIGFFHDDPVEAPNQINGR